MLIRKPTSFEFLLGFLLVLLVLVPVLRALDTGLALLAVNAAIVITAARVAWTHELRFGVVLVLGLAAFFGDLIWKNAYVSVADIAFFSYLTVAFMGYIFRQSKVTSNVVAASLCVYILIGFLWVFLYQVLDHFDQQLSFTPDEPERADLVYFSFVTLTTLGYGDITPVSPHAKAAAMVEAIVGQIYLIVIVARLVALQITHELQDERKS